MRLLPHRMLFVVGTAAIVTVTSLTAPAQAASDRATYQRWESSSDFARGALSNATISGGAVRMAGGTSSSWTSPWTKLDYSATNLIPTWRATTKTGNWIVVEARVRKGSTTGSWDTLAEWSNATKPVKRRSGTTQSDDLTKVSVDTLKANSGKSFTSYQLRITLRRSSTKDSAPVVGAVTAVAANFSTRAPATSKTTMTKTIDLAVPMLSQMTHRKHNTTYDGGGAAWCSPTSATMLMRYFQLAPPAADYAWTKEKQGYVDHAARYSYDYRYEGTGNWSFTTAYAGRFGANASVTRLTSLRDAERFIQAGIPLAASIAFKKGGLTGAPLTSTPGHIVVIRGFTSSGKVIVNDPAAPKDSTVKRTYSRAQFEKAWQSGSGGVVYVIRPHSTPLPPDTERW